MNKLLTSKLDLEKLLPELNLHSSEFIDLKNTDFSIYKKKLRNSTIVFCQNRDLTEFSPLPWLLARMGGCNWSDTNYRKWIMPPENYRSSLREIGLRMLKEGDDVFDEIRHAYISKCKDDDFLPSNHRGDTTALNREFWLLDVNQSRNFPDEFNQQEVETLIEGAKKQIFVNAYERNPNARVRCIEKFGYICQVCELNFEQKYGEIGREFIHVHHKVALSKIGKDYIVDPLVDLIPLCPNCHAMIHRLGKLDDIEALKEILDQRN